jgi:catechol 2,3-dioxygenase-like lactoylglutathione lyase family enzyme
MPAVKIDHINIRTQKPEETRDFFVEVVGLRDGERPPFNFGGYWLYAGDQACVHIVDARDRDAHGIATGRSGAAIDHVSFRMTGYAALREKLRQRNLAAEMRVVPRTGDVQVFVDDPNGVSLELTFAGAEVPDNEKAALTSR